MPAKASQSFRLELLGATDLIGADGGDARAILAQPKRFALLVWLLLAGRGRFVRRDSVVALFWPEANGDAARHALRQALHFLRRTLGQSAIVRRGEDEIAIDGDVLGCDVVEFERVLDEGRVTDALALYTGDLLPGFYATDVSVEFQQWLDAERGRLRQRAADAAWQASEHAESAGNREDALHFARLASRFAPDDEQAFRRLLDLLDRLGDRAGALRAYDDFRRRLAEELEVEPGPAVQRAAAEIRARTVVEPVRVVRAPNAQPADITGDAVGSPDLIGTGWRLGGRRFAPLWLALFLGVVAATAGTVAWRIRSSSDPVLAVGAIDVASDSGGSRVDPAVRGLLATDLSRVVGLEVVSQARLYEILGQLGHTEENPTLLSDVARRAGATELLEGSLVRVGRDSFRLDLRRVDLRRGVVRGAVSIAGRDLLGMVRLASIEIADQLALPAPEPLTGVGPPGVLAAQRLYEQGLRAYYRGDVDAAAPLFDAALAEDSTLAMAAYYGSTVAGERRDSPKMFQLADQALRTVHQAPHRDQLIVRVGWMELYSDPRRLVLAESLAARYPNDPAAIYAWAKALSWNGDALAAIPHLHRVVALESLSLRAGSPLCRACDAMHELMTGYSGIDSLRAAERTIREWLRYQPNAPRPWTYLSQVLELSGREQESLDAAATAVRLGGLMNLSFIRARIALRAGRFEEADRLLRQIATEAPNESDALWWLIISLRNQRRFVEALSVATRHRRLVDSIAESPLQLEAAAPVAQTLFEMGRYRDAAALFDSIAHDEAARSNPAPGLLARRTVWPLTHAATAIAAARDTVALARLITRVEALGRESGFGRDRRLHHYVRALQARSRGDLELTVRELRAVEPMATGFGRANLELGQALLALHRPTEAIAALRPPLSAAMEASGYYSTFRELHETLAAAFEAAGQPDSAATHRAWVARAVAASAKR